jgi:hypothetical protein
MLNLNEVYEYLKMNGLPVTLHDYNTRIRLEGSTAALDNILFLKVYKRQSDISYSVASSPSIELVSATYRHLDALIDSYTDALLENCDNDRIRSVRQARLRHSRDRYARDRYAGERHKTQTP